MRYFKGIQDRIAYKPALSSLFIDPDGVDPVNE
jgi:hypothetical protein